MSVRTALRLSRSRARRIATAGFVAATAATVGVTGLAGSAHAVDLDGNRALAQKMITNDAQFECFTQIVDHESDWDHTATNPESGAYGLVQALPAKRMQNAGSDWKTNPRTQIEWGVDYMKARYGSPCDAWDFWQNNGWY